MEALLGVFNQALMITGFVFVMMLVIEYINVLTSGSWHERVAVSYSGQYLFAAFMGIIPGCLGTFVVVAMYSHRMLSVGAVVTAMIATSGDEAYVMLAMIPRDAMLLMGILFFLGLVTGILTDVFLKSNYNQFAFHFHDSIYTGVERCEGFQLHTFGTCQCYPKDGIIAQWKASSPNRIILAFVLGLFAVALVSGQVGPQEWNWVRLSILFVTFLALFIVTTVSENFLKKHLWDHIARNHVPRIFIWTFGALLVTHILVEQLYMEELIRQNLWAVLGISSLIGLIPESGPHLVFVTLFANRAVPFGILMASSMVQDGHGMLPLLAHSPRTFIFVKLINLFAGLIVGSIILFFTQTV
ncbi:MAG: putative manganese transporter [Balneolales bacterium]